MHILEMPIETPLLLTVVSIAIFTFLIQAVILRWMFNVNQNTRQNEIQTNLLLEIAKTLKVPSEDLFKALGREVPESE
jgi:hypothetical protein